MLWWPCSPCVIPVCVLCGSSCFVQDNSCLVLSRYKFVTQVLKALTREGREDFSACTMLGKHPSENMTLMATEVMSRIRTLRTQLKCSPRGGEGHVSAIVALAFLCCQNCRSWRDRVYSERKPSLEQLVCDDERWTHDDGDAEAISVYTLRAAVDEYASILSFCVCLICSTMFRKGIPPLIQALIPTPHKKADASADADGVDLADFPGLSRKPCRLRLNCCCCCYLLCTL